jgi:hypothetical protein
MKPELPIEPSAEALEVVTLRKTNAELVQKSATRKARIAELEASAATLQAKATEGEARIRQLTIDGPVNDLCESISVAPQALRSALEAEYKIEMHNGVLTLLNPSDSKPVMQDGKPVPFTPEGIKNMLLASKDEAKLKLYNAIIIANRASGAGGALSSQRATNTPAKPQFGLGMSLK